MKINNTSSSLAEVLTKDLVTQLYSSDGDGILVLKNRIYKYIKQEELKKWYRSKGEGFQRKDEKYIENNQEVSVVFNDSISRLHILSGDEERILHNLYLAIRLRISELSDIPFLDGDRLETKLIKYPVSSLGVGAHRDLSSNINCIVLFNLYGSAYFYTADDKERGGEKRYWIEEGDIVLMRGPRNQDENDLRPIHYVLDIPEERLVFVCREIEDKVEKIVNKDNWRGF